MAKSLYQALDQSTGCLHVAIPTELGERIALSALPWHFLSFATFAGTSKSSQGASLGERRLFYHGWCELIGFGLGVVGLPHEALNLKP